MTFTAGREAIDANGVTVSELCFALCEEGRALVWLIVDVDAHSLIIVVHNQVDGVPNFSFKFQKHVLGVQFQEIEVA